jgi:hypothetical protein
MSSFLTSALLEPPLSLPFTSFSFRINMAPSCNLETEVSSSNGRHNQTKYSRIRLSKLFCWSFLLSYCILYVFAADTLMPVSLTLVDSFPHQVRSIHRICQGKEPTYIHGYTGFEDNGKHELLFKFPESLCLSCHWVSSSQDTSQQIRRRAWHVYSVVKTKHMENIVSSKYF